MIELIARTLGLDKIAIYVFIALITLCGIGITYYEWKKDIENQALSKFNTKQMEQIINDEHDYQAKQQTIANDQSLIIRKTDDVNTKIDTKINKINAVVSFNAKKQDKQASDVLKNTIKMLSEDN